MPPLAEWQTFLSVQAGAAAALTGLVFVAGVSIDLGRIVSRTTMTQFSGVPFGVAGILLALRNPVGIYWLVPGIVFSFIAGVSSAWVLLVKFFASAIVCECVSRGHAKTGRSQFRRWYRRRVQGRLVRLRLPGR